jgi:hypothetical protein
MPGIVEITEHLDLRLVVAGENRFDKIRHRMLAQIAGHIADLQAFAGRARIRMRAPLRFQGRFDLLPEM